MIKLIKFIAGRAIDRLPRKVARKLKDFPESGMDYTIVAVKTKDGKIHRRVALGDSFLGIGHSGVLLDTNEYDLPFRLNDVIDIEWEGYRAGQTTERPDPPREEWLFSAPSDRLEVAPHHRPQWSFECTACGTTFPPLPVQARTCQCGNISFDVKGRPTIKDQNSVKIFSDKQA